jgi:hypothetical protein
LKDSIITGSIIGLLANIPKIAIDFLGYYWGISEYHCWRMQVQVFFPREWLSSFHSWIIGGLTDNIFAAAMGVGLIYFLRFAGSRHAFLKGIAYSLGVWFFVCLMMSGKQLESPIAFYRSFINHQIYGLCSILLLLKYGRASYQKII